MGGSDDRGRCVGNEWGNRKRDDAIEIEEEGSVCVSTKYVSSIIS